MKSTIVAAIAASMTLLYACNNQPAATQKEESAVTKETINGEEHVSILSARFTDLDAGVVSYLKNLTDSYLQVKNALTNSNAAEAAGASKNIYEAATRFDKSLLSAAQKKVYDLFEARLKKDAAALAQSTGDVEKERSQFSLLSLDMYELVSGFSVGKKLYHDHCPMAMNNKGAMWLSETKDIKNPYYGNEMPECGNVVEELQ